jgi:hypothetical protein
MKIFNVERVISDMILCGQEVAISDRNDSVYVVGSLENETLVEVLNQYVNKFSLKLKYYDSVNCFAIF